MALSEVYIDESYDSKGPPVLCLAGYVYRKREVTEFTREWSRYLKERGLPYFHMSECAHGQGIFKGRDDADEVARSLIGRTVKSTAFGFAVMVNEDDYSRLVKPREMMPTAYAFALMACLVQVRKWQEKNSCLGPTAYFFEEGHQHAGDAHAFLSWMFESERVKHLYGYSGHAFIKKETPALHPADMLAWQWRLEASRRADPQRTRKPRRDFEALIRPTDLLADYNLQTLHELNGVLQEGEVERHRLIQEALVTGVVPPLPVIKGFP